MRNVPSRNYEDGIRLPFVLLGSRGQSQEENSDQWSELLRARKPLELPEDCGNEIHFITTLGRRPLHRPNQHLGAKPPGPTDGIHLLARTTGHCLAWE